MPMEALHLPLHVLKFHVNPKLNCSKRLDREVKITGATQSDLSQGKSYYIYLYC